MIRRIVWTSIGAALIVVALTVAWTQTQKWYGRRNSIWFHRGPMGYMAYALNLSDMQKSQVKSIWDGEQPNVAGLIHVLASEQREMDALTFGGVSPEEQRIENIATRQGATFAMLIAEKEKLTGKIYSQVLDPAQRAKADGLRKHWSSRLDNIADRIANTSGEK